MPPVCPVRVCRLSGFVGWHGPELLALSGDELATQPDGQIRTALANLPVQSPQRKYFTSRVGQITSRTPAVLPHRGVLRNVINAGRDAVDASCAFDEWRGRGRRSRVVLTSRRWRQALRRYSRGDGDKKARSPGSNCVEVDQ